MRSRRSERNLKKDQEASHTEKLRLKYNLLGILVLALMGILAFDLAGVSTWISRVFGGNI